MRVSMYRGFVSSKHESVIFDDFAFEQNQLQSIFGRSAHFPEKQSAGSWRNHLHSFLMSRFRKLRIYGQHLRRQSFYFKQYL